MSVGKPVSISVNPDAFKASIHGGMFACVDCHTDVKTSPHENTPAKISCATCHADQQAAYDRSYHAKAIQAGDAQAATCVSCHGSPHELLAGQRSEVARESCEYSGDLWILSRTEICDGGKRT